MKNYMRRKEEEENRDLLHGGKKTIRFMTPQMNNRDIPYLSHCSDCI